MAVVYQHIPQLTSLRPWACQFCKLINWPQHMDGTPRVVCHKCSAKKEMPISR